MIGQAPIDAPARQLRLALYARVSSDDQARNATVASQLDAVRAYAAELGTLVADPGGGDAFVDEGWSGKSLDRPAMGRLRDLLAAGAIDAVVAHDIDRLSRDQADLYQLVYKELIGCGVDLYVAKTRTRFEDDEQGRILFAVFALTAELERGRIGQRARRGLEHRARVEGRKNGGIAPFGYSMGSCTCATTTRRHGGPCEAGRYVLDPAEVAWCQQMSRWLLEDGLTPGLIAQRLQQLEVPTKYDTHGIERRESRPSVRPRRPFTWYPDQVRRILTDPLYGGEWRYQPRRADPTRRTPAGRPRRVADGPPVVVPIPAIFDAPTLDAHRQQIGRNRSLRKRQGGAPFLLRSLITCGECGRRYVAGYASAQRIYRCGVWHHPRLQRDCTNKGWTAKRLEGIVWRAVSELVQRPEAVLEGLQLREQPADRPDLHLAQLEGRLTTLDEEDERVRSAYRKGVVYTAEEAEAELAKSAHARAVITTELAEIRAQVRADEAAQQRGQRLEDALAQVRERLPQLTDDERREVLQQLITRITVLGQAVEIEVVISAPKKWDRPGGPT